MDTLFAKKLILGQGAVTNAMWESIFSNFTTDALTSVTTVFAIGVARVPQATPWVSAMNYPLTTTKSPLTSATTATKEL
jgi:hypothetical protein